MKIVFEKSVFFKCFAWDVANTNSNFAPSGKSIKTRVNNFQKQMDFRKLHLEYLKSYLFKSIKTTFFLARILLTSQ